MPVRDDSGLHSIVTQVNVLNSKIQLLIQEINDIKGKLAIISRTVISQKNQLDELNTKVESVESAGGLENSATGQTLNVEKEIQNIKDELKEMKYVVDSVNPVAYVTVDEVSDLIDEKMMEKGLKKKS